MKKFDEFEYSFELPSWVAVPAALLILFLIMRGCTAAIDDVRRAVSP